MARNGEKRTTGRSFQPGETKGNKTAVKHGLYSLKRTIDGGLDKRTSLYHALREKESELIQAIGGDPSPQERMIVNDIVRTALYVGTCDAYLAKLDDLMFKGRPHPILDVRTKLAGHLREDLRAIGLHRRVKTTSINDLLNQDANEPKANGSNNASEHDIVQQ